MAKFFFGNNVNATTVTYNNIPSYTAQIIVTRSYAGYDPDSNDNLTLLDTYDIPLGVLTDVNLSWATAVKAVCKPLQGNEIIASYRTINTRPIPFSANVMEFNFTESMWAYAPNDNPRLIAVQTKTVSQQVGIFRNFIVGNHSNGAGQVSQIGDINFKAKVNITKNSIVTENNLVAGVSKSIDIENASKVEVIIEPINSHKLVSVKTGVDSVNNNIPIDSGLITIVNLSADHIQSTNDFNKKFVVTTELSVFKIFYFGNDVDITGKPIKTGANSFTGVLTLYGAFDPENPTETPEKTFNVESGTELGLILTPSFSRGKIDLTVVDGFEFTGVNFPYEATYTNNTVSYNFPDDKEELNPSDEMNRYYIATTKTTGGIDPEPSDEPITIANNYLVTKEELTEFNKQIYNITGFEKTENASTLITEYISAIRIYPFILPPENLYNRGVIKVKRSKLNTATIINSDIITVDLGNINIARKYNNALDFINVKPELILPFCNGSISIDPEYLLGSTVNIQMKIDIISGNVTVNLKSDLIDGIFEVKSDSIGGDYPFYGRYDIIQKTFEPSQAINNIVTAYVILETPIYTGSIKSKKEGLLTGVKGDVIIDRIKLNVIATTGEKDDLQYLLKNGVFIK